MTGTDAYRGRHTPEQSWGQITVGCTVCVEAAWRAILWAENTPLGSSRFHCAKSALEYNIPLEWKRRTGIPPDANPRASAPILWRPTLPASHRCMH